MHILKGAWAFKLKLTPDGIAYIHRSRFCIKGDQHKYGVNYFETFATEVKWSTIRLMLIFILNRHLVTGVIYYINAYMRIDRTYGVYNNMSSLTGGDTSMGEGIIHCKSLKQKQTFEVQQR